MVAWPSQWFWNKQKVHRIRSSAKKVRYQMRYGDETITWWREILVESTYKIYLVAYRLDSFKAALQDKHSCIYLERLRNSLANMCETNEIALATNKLVYKAADRVFSRDGFQVECVTRIPVTINLTHTRLASVSWDLSMKVWIKQWNSLSHYKNDPFHSTQSS